MFAFAQFFTLKRQLMLFIGSFVCIFLFHYWFGFAGSWLPFLIALFLGVKYVILGTVNGAVMEMQMGNFPEAEKILGWTRFPHWLRFGYHGVFYMLKSQMAFQRGDHNAAESYAEKALSLDLQDDMKAGLYLELVNIYGMRKNVPKVKEFMQKAKKIEHHRSPNSGQIQRSGANVRGQTRIPTTYATTSPLCAPTFFQKRQKINLQPFKPTLYYAYELF